jgi:hypothetical protein
VLHAGGVEPALFGKVGDAAIAARFLVRRGADLDRAGEIGMGVEERLAAMTEAAIPPFMSQVPRP